MKSIVRTLTVICLPMLMLACGGPSERETQANVDSGNAAKNTALSIQRQLASENIYLISSDFSKDVIRSMSKDELTNVRSQLVAYIANVKVALARSEQPNVTWDPTTKQNFRNWANIASDLIRAIDEQRAEPAHTDRDKDKR